MQLLEHAHSFRGRDEWAAVLVHSKWAKARGRGMRPRAWQSVVKPRWFWLVCGGLRVWWTVSAPWNPIKITVFLKDNGFFTGESM